jgi:hypothetical protein
VRMRKAPLQMPGNKGQSRGIVHTADSA